jgi:PelA/Pel-15E family pectate lyase
MNVVEALMKPSSILLFLALATFARAFPGDLLKKSDDWFRSDAGRTAVENVISWQAESGSWPKNQDNARKRNSGSQQETGTFDNGSTTDELRFLARAFAATDDASARKAFLRGYDHILDAQYRNGGWPQYFPPGKQYHRHITFNDNTMVRLLEFLRETARDERYEFIGDARRKSARRAFDRGIECILECQVVREGKLTVWCAQHDETTLKPAMARSYELESLSGSESAGIVRFLMSLEKPSPEVVRAVKAAVAWFEASGLRGIRIEKIDGVRTAVEDAKAPVLWARFYDIETNRPFFCDRDGVKKWHFNEIGRERRNGYAWFGGWGESVLKEYAKWSHR